jgi:hypothetical protein
LPFMVSLGTVVYNVEKNRRELMNILYLEKNLLGPTSKIYFQSSSEHQLTDKKRLSNLSISLI